MALLAGKIALVTGAAQGNGRAIALGLAEAGADVIATDVNLEGCKAVAADIAARGRKSWAYALDVSDDDSCQRIAAQVAKDVGDLAVLVNNAGILLRDSINDGEKVKQHWDRTMRINADGPFNVTRAFLEPLKRTKGSVINIASIQSFVAIANSVAYNAAKGAVKQLTKVLAVELARDGVRVNAIAPGVMATPMTAAIRDRPQVMAQILPHIPMGRVGQPEELVGPTVFLASDLSSYVTGAILPVDGGYLCV